MTPAAARDADERSPEELALAAFLDRMAGDRDFPSFVENVRQITKVSRDAAASARLLVDALAQDVNLTAKVLRMANSVTFNRNGAGITDLRFAIMLVGFERVRDLAVGASVFNHLRQRAPGLKELLVASLLSANQALHLAAASGYRRHEEAYLCGMFRNLGEVVAACYATDLYARLVALRGAGTLDGPAAEREVFGFTFDQLGVVIGQRWGLPPQVLATMRPSTAPDPAPGGGALPPAGHLQAVTELSHGLTGAVYRIGADADAERLPPLVQAYARPLGLDDETVRGCLKDALTDAEATLRAVGVSLDRLRLEQQMAEALALLGETPDDAVRRRAALGDGPEGRGRGRVGGDDAAAAGAAGGGAAAPLSAQEALAARVAATLEAMRGMGYQRAVFALATADHTSVRARLVSPPRDNVLLKRWVVPLAPPPSPFARAMAGGDDAQADRVAGTPWAAEPVLRALQVQRFVLLPIHVRGTLVGTLYADGGTTAAGDVGGVLRTLRDQLRQLLEEPAG